MALEEKIGSLMEGQNPGFSIACDDPEGCGVVPRLTSLKAIECLRFWIRMPKKGKEKKKKWKKERGIKGRKKQGRKEQKKGRKEKKKNERKGRKGGKEIIAFLYYWRRFFPDIPADDGRGGTCLISLGRAQFFIAPLSKIKTSERNVLAFRG